jgi:osmotically-inducible protein OsmY
MLRAIGWMSIGGTVAALADPVSGARRRHVARDRGLATARRGGRWLRRQADYRAGEAYGMVREAMPGGRRSPDDDRTLADKVRSEAFRGLPVTPREANVGVVEGVVTLRGQLPSQYLIAELERRVRTVPGVRGVENLLHLVSQEPRGAGRA